MLADIPHQLSPNFDHQRADIYDYQSAEESSSYDEDDYCSCTEDEIEYNDLKSAMDYLESFVQAEDLNADKSIDSHVVTVVGSSAAMASDFVASRLRSQREASPKPCSDKSVKDDGVDAESTKSASHDIRSFEESFCRDFSCCGLTLPDMHALLRHYEEFHVHIESDNDLSENDDDDDEIIIEDYYAIIQGNSTISSHSHASRYSADFDDFLFEGGDVVDVSAFHDSVVLPRKRSSAPVEFSLVRRIGDVEDDLGARILELVHEEMERSRKRLKMTEDENGSHFIRSDDDIDGDDDECDGFGGDENALGETEGSDSDYDCRLSHHQRSSLEDDSKEDKPYRCVYPGCDKAYKNANGLKYHNLHGHAEGDDEDLDLAARLMKPYVCNFSGCHKRYKNLNGLKYHIEKAHVLTKSEANKIATSIVKKTNSRYGIKSRNVPGPVLFAAMKEHEERQRNSESTSSSAEITSSESNSQESGTCPVGLPGTIFRPQVPLAPKTSSMSLPIDTRYSAPVSSQKLSFPHTSSTAQPFIPLEKQAFPIHGMPVAQGQATFKIPLLPASLSTMSSPSNAPLSVPSQIPAGNSSPSFPVMPASSIPAYFQSLISSGYVNMKNFPFYVGPQQTSSPTHIASGATINPAVLSPSATFSQQIGQNK